MIESIGIWNYRCFAGDCRLELQPLTLLLGPNGSGKSSVFDLIRTLKRVKDRQALIECLKPTDVNRWGQDAVCGVTVRLRHLGAVFEYALQALCSDASVSLGSESLSRDGVSLFATDSAGELSLYLRSGRRDFYVDVERSALLAISGGPDEDVSAALSTFRQALDQIQIVRPNPPLFLPDARAASTDLDEDGSNFVAWYRAVARRYPEKQARYFAELAEVIPGFVSLELLGPDEATQTMMVRIRPSEGAEPQGYKLPELSDGQRQLLLLYACLYAQDNRWRTLCFDEPDNFLSLGEVQPWLTALVEEVGHGLDQAILISHHPEVVDYLAYDSGLWFERGEGGVVSVRKRRPVESDTLSASEIEARGWRP